MRAPWHQFQESGYRAMDDEHDRLAVSLAGFLDAVNANDLRQAIRLLDDLVRQYGSHFAHEERLMTESRYELAERHRQAHAVILEDAGRHLAEARKNGLSAPFRRWAAGRAVEGFRLHIATNDVGLGRFLAARARSSRG